MGALGGVLGEAGEFMAEGIETAGTTAYNAGEAIGGSIGKTLMNGGELVQGSGDVLHDASIGNWDAAGNDLSQTVSTASDMLMEGGKDYLTAKIGEHVMQHRNDKKSSVSAPDMSKPQEEAPSARQVMAMNTDAGENMKWLYSTMKK